MEIDDHLLDELESDEVPASEGQRQWRRQVLRAALQHVAGRDARDRETRLSFEHSRATQGDPRSGLGTSEVRPRATAFLLLPQD